MPGEYSCSGVRSPGNTPTGKGAGRRDFRGSNPYAGQHQVIMFALPRLTVTSFKSSKATERRAPAGQWHGQQAPPAGTALSAWEWSSRPPLETSWVEQGCQPLPNSLLGLPGREPISPVPLCCQRLSRSLSSTPACCAARGMGSSQHFHPKSLGVASRGSPSPTANILSFNLPGSSRDWEEGSSAQMAPLTQEGMHPCPSLGGDQELRNRL